MQSRPSKTSAAHEVFLRRLAAVAAALLLVVGCAGTTPASSQPSGGSVSAAPASVTPASASTATAVHLTFSGNQPQTTFDEAIAAFQKLNPNITVAYEAVPFAQYDDVLAQRLGGGGATPDLFEADQPQIPSEVARHFLLDLTDQLGDLKGKVLDATIEASTVNGRLYAVPLSTSTVVMYYNTKLLQAAGIALPSPDPTKRWTWEQTVDAAKKAQAAGAKWGLVIDQLSRIYQFLPLPESLGAGNGVKGTDNLTPDVTNPGWVKAATFYGSLFAQGLAPRGVPDAEVEGLFANGEVAFIVAGPWAAAQYKDVPFGITAHPYFAGGKPATPTGGYSLGINPNSPNKEAALAFIKYLSLDPEGGYLASKDQPVPTANIAALTQYMANPAWHSANTEGVSDLMTYEIQNTAVNRPRTVGYVQFQSIMNQALADIASGQEPASRLAKASEDVTAAFSRLTP